MAFWRVWNPVASELSSSMAHQSGMWDSLVAMTTWPSQLMIRRLCQDGGKSLESKASRPHYPHSLQFSMDINEQCVQQSIAGQPHMGWSSKLNPTQQKKIPRLLLFFGGTFSVAVSLWLEGSPHSNYPTLQASPTKTLYNLHQNRFFVQFQGITSP